MTTRSIQILACAFEVELVGDLIERLFDPLVHHSRQNSHISNTHRLRIAHGEDGVSTFFDGVLVDRRSAPEDAVEAAFWHMQDRALAALPEHTKIHAGCATYRGRRALFVGPKESGKTTLLTRLAFEGFSVHSDDIVLLRSGITTPFPRPFRLRTSAEHLLPKLPSAAFVQRGDRNWLDLSLVIDDWHTLEAPADVINFLEPRFDCPATFEACPKHEMVRHVMEHSSRPASGPALWAREICLAVEAARCYVLRSGSLDSTVEVVRTIMAYEE